jgi:hypothetical protein
MSGACAVPWRKTGLSFSIFGFIRNASMRSFCLPATKRLFRYEYAKRPAMQRRMMPKMYSPVESEDAMVECDGNGG